MHDPPKNDFDLCRKYNSNELGKDRVGIGIDYSTRFMKSYSRPFAKCNQESKKSCPPVKQGKLCIEVSATSKMATISEELCIGLPIPKLGNVVGLVGRNGTGKSTALKILSGDLIPNLGRFDNPPTWQEILKNLDHELRNYFTLIHTKKLKAIIKPQYVDDISKKANDMIVGRILEQEDERGVKAEVCADLELNQLLDRKVGELSGGELQRFVIAARVVQDAQMYMFDEPSSYLDIKQRLKAAQVIRSLLTPKRYVVVIDHDLSVLDYLSDYVCCLYGNPGAYGVVTVPYTVKQGINVYLDGYAPTENLRFRQESLTFKTPQESVEEIQTYARYRYPSMSKTHGDFKLRVVEGEFTDSQIMVMLGENGTGKTTFIQMLMRRFIYFQAWAAEMCKENKMKEAFKVSYKPQRVLSNSDGSVRSWLKKSIPNIHDSQFVSDVIKPLEIEELMDRNVQDLSGDEPSAYLDSEQRINASKVIRRFILRNKKTAFVIEHDFLMATYLADRVIVYEGTPSIDCVANAPQSLLTGMNLFLSHLGITFRRDSTNYRPRINRLNSALDTEQKCAGIPCTKKEDTVSLTVGADPTIGLRRTQLIIFLLIAKIDLFILIRAPNPTKVKTGSRPRAPHELPLLTLTAPRVIEMDEPTAATDSSGVPSVIERSPLDFAYEAEASGKETAAPEMPPPEEVPITTALGTDQAAKTVAVEPPAVRESRKRGHEGIDANALPKSLRRYHADLRPS
nr:ABC transporter E family member 2 [Tanacetum cinerariifolium]